MHCPICRHTDSRVLDSRLNQAGTRIRRRRACEACNERFTTYEVQETIEVMVLKKDGRREPLDVAKLTRGIARACEKRPVAYERVEEMAAQIAQNLSDAMVREVHVRQLGELVLAGLRRVDPVAYVRFLSVYREFETPQQFLDELSGILAEGPLVGASEPTAREARS